MFKMDTQKLFNMSTVMLPLILCELQIDTLHKMRELSKTTKLWSTDLFLKVNLKSWLQKYKHAYSYVLHTVGAIEAR